MTQEQDPVAYLTVALQRIIDICDGAIAIINSLDVGSVGTPQRGITIHPRTVVTKVSIPTPTAHAGTENEGPDRDAT